MEKGISRFQFLWGESELKKRFLAKPHSFVSYIQFRSCSLNYFFSKVNIFFFNILKDFKGSKFSKHLRSAIKFYRKKRWKANLSSI
jgi:hypothetical protein